MFLDANGSVVAAGDLHPGTTPFEDARIVASHDTFGVFTQATPDQSILFGLRYTTSGVALDPAPVQIASGPRIADEWDVAFDGEQWALAAVDFNPDAMRVVMTRSTAGIAEWPAVTLSESAYAFPPQVVATGAMNLILWLEPSDAFFPDIVMQRVGLDGRLLGDAPLLLAAGVSVAAASNGTHVLIVWAAPGGLQAGRLDPYGSVVDPRVSRKRVVSAPSDDARRMQTRKLALVLPLLLLIGISADAQSRRRAMRSPGVPEPQVTTFDVIDRAAAEGRVSDEQAMLYKVFSIYGDARLPQEMKGDDSGLPDTVYMTEVAASYATLPVDVQEQIAPFLIPPFHRNSWWEMRQQNARSIGSHSVASFGFGIERPCTDCPLSFDWKFIPTANGKVKVWYLGSNALDELKAKGFASEIDNVIWPKLKGLLGREPLPDEGDGWLGASLGGDSRLDIALVDIPRSVTTARYSEKCHAGAWAYIQFNKNKPREELAHEVMHAFQYAFNVKVRGGDCTGEAEYRWLMESTAEWVKDFIYPGSTSPHNEHWAAPHYLKVPEAPLNIAADPHWYGAYLLPFFLARVKGQTNIVGQIWANTESVASLQAIENALQPLGGFEKVWPEFVLHNWNDDPVDDYRKSDQLQHRPTALGEPLLSGGAVDKYASLNFELHHLTSSYKHFVLNGNVNSVAFLNGMTFKISTEPRVLLNTWDLGDQYKWEPVPAQQKKGASVQAILKRNGKWEKPEDWTNVAYKAFCLQKPDERIEEIVLIFANSNIDENSVLKPAGQPPLLIVTDMGCRFEGTVDWDSSGITKQGFGNVDLLYRNTFEPRDFMEPVQHFLGYYYDTNGNASWSVTGPVGPCGVNANVPNAGIRTDLLSFSMNFAPKGSKGYRKGYYQLHTAQPVSYALHCPGGDVPMSPTFIYFPAISFDPLMYLQNAPGGGLKDTVSNPLGTWKWDYKVKR